MPADGTRALGPIPARPGLPTLARTVPRDDDLNPMTGTMFRDREAAGDAETARGTGPRPKGVLG